MRFWPILGITALLAALGGAAGAVGGALIASGIIAAMGNLPNFLILRGLFFTAGAVGFAVGFVTGPALAWTLLRRAPIWRAIGETAIGAGVGASAALALGVGFGATIAVSVAVALLAALRLRRAVGRLPAPESTKQLER